MMQQPQETGLAIAPPTALQTAHLVQVNGKTYHIAEVSPQPIQPHPWSPPSSPPSGWDDPRTIIFLGCGVVVGTGILTALVMKALMPVQIAPAPPQTVIVQPAQPEKKPYSFRECTPGGLFGWGQNCREERGWQ